MFNFIRSKAATTAKPARIVIVGGGAGGLILATRLARSAQRRGLCEVVLVDQSLTHIWKPLLHEIAAGSLDSYQDEVGYYKHAARNGYQFQFGRFKGVDRNKRVIQIDAAVDRFGVELIPAREVHYDYLVMALGSVSNDFGIPGVREHCVLFEGREQAERLHSKLLGLFASAQGEHAADARPPRTLNIIGGGPTGVELATEIRSSLRAYCSQFKPGLGSTDIHINLIEAGPTLLPGQPESMIKAVANTLKRMNVQVYCNAKVTQVAADSLEIQDGPTLPATATIWAAGVQAPACLSELSGLETNRARQLKTNTVLQTLGDDRIYAIGDCAEVILNEQRLGPRAQVAQQEAFYLAKSIEQRLLQKSVDSFVFTDRGTVVSLGQSDSAANLLAPMLGQINIHGLIARMSYAALYRKHQLALFGLYPTTLMFLKDQLFRTLGPKLKLH